MASFLREADGQAATRQLLALPNPPDAVFAAGDFAALGCLRELLAQG